MTVLALVVWCFPPSGSKILTFDYWPGHLGVRMWDIETGLLEHSTAEFDGDIESATPLSTGCNRFAVRTEESCVGLDAESGTRINEVTE